MTRGWIRRLQPVLVYLGTLLLLVYAAGLPARGQPGKPKESPKDPKKPDLQRFDPKAKQVAPPTITAGEESDNTWIIVTVVVVVLVGAGGVGAWLMLQQG